VRGGKLTCAECDAESDEVAQADGLTSQAPCEGAEGSPRAVLLLSELR
jgi:hypothetical protein